MVLKIPRTSRALGVLGLLLITSCMDVPERVSDRSDAEKNLAAIRELLKPLDNGRSIHSRSLGGGTSGDRHEELPRINELLPSSDGGSVNPSYLPISSQFKVSSKERIQSSQRPVYIPWRPSATNASEMAEPFRPVPPYMTTMPAVPGSPSPVRCSPDFFGGQRCH